MTIIIFIIILALLILSHEFGHFIFAKKYGIEVSEFGFGLPPRITGKKIGETLYSLNLIPFGGFVRIKGEDGEDKGDPRSFSSHPASTRALILAGGVLFNILLAYFLFSFIAWFGSPTAINSENIKNAENVQVIIGQVAESSPAQNAGLLTGDSIISLSFADEFLTVAPRDTDSIEKIQNFIAAHEGRTIELTVVRDAEEITVQSFSRLDPPEDEGRIGIALSQIGIVRRPFYLAPWDGLKETYYSFTFTIRAFYEILQILVSGGDASVFIAGPIGIVSIVSQTISFGIPFVIRLTALLSINLAIINLLPIPALDGGRLAFLLAEVVRGRPISSRVSHFAHAVGFALLILLMIIVTIYDIQRFF